MARLLVARLRLRSRRWIPARNSLSRRLCSSVVIFDFDLTLVDTGRVEALRTARKWGAVMARVPGLEVYEGVHELLSDLHTRDQKLAIVTNSPDMVPKAFVKRHRWLIDIVVGYHQVRKRKPDPEALLLAMRRAGANPADTFHVGDQPEDTEAARAANIMVIGAAWGLADTAPLEAWRPDRLFMSVGELRKFFRP